MSLDCRGLAAGRSIPSGEPPNDLILVILALICTCTSLPEMSSNSESAHICVSNEPRATTAHCPCSSSFEGAPFLVLDESTVNLDKRTERNSAENRIVLGHLRYGNDHPSNSPQCSHPMNSALFTTAVKSKQARAWSGICRTIWRGQNPDRH